MDITDEQIILQLQVIKQKSEEMYEKSIYLISSGTLLISITLIEKVVILSTSVILWSLISSWIFLVLTLVLNLVSHQVASHLHGQTVDDFKKKNKKTEDNVRKRNRLINGINLATSIFLVLGISLLVLFCSVNVNKMNRETDHIRPQTIEPDQQKGMPINIPRGPSIAPQPNNPPARPASPPTQSPTPPQSTPSK